MKKYFTKEVKIALVAIGGIVVLFFGIKFLKGMNLFSDDDTYYMTFQNIAGLGTAAPIYADGYKIGNTVYNSPIPSEENIVRTNAYGDNFLAYYDIIYNRKYNGIDIPNNRVTSIKDYKEIRYKDEDKYNYENPNKDVCKAKSLEEYLKIAYEPMSDLGEIKVTEVICRTFPIVFFFISSFIFLTAGANWNT